MGQPQQHLRRFRQRLLLRLSEQKWNWEGFRELEVAMSVKKESERATEFFLRSFFWAGGGGKGRDDTKIAKHGTRG